VRENTGGGTPNKNNSEITKKIHLKRTFQRWSKYVVRSSSDSGGKTFDEQRDLRNYFEPYFEPRYSESIFEQRDSVIELIPLSKKEKERNIETEQKGMIVQRETRYKLTHWLLLCFV